eukprot:7380494-Prymnesium_polylepis.2
MSGTLRGGCSAAMLGVGLPAVTPPSAVVVARLEQWPIDWCWWCVAAAAGSRALGGCVGRHAKLSYAARQLTRCCVRFRVCRAQRPEEGVRALDDRLRCA